MLITKLGSVRRELLEVIAPLTDDALQHLPEAGGPSIAQILQHLAETERSVAQLILGAVKGASERAAEYDLAQMRAAIPTLALETEAWGVPVTPDTPALTKAGLIRALEESRFRYLQRVFNETHEATLLQKSTVHPVFGLISLKNLVDFVWLHEQYHVEQIRALQWTAA
ncbi:MAG: DinB family protein [Burkholderiaceae bacterium]|nr:MAG: DinB family protein [Burkholderiaceae bacterium]